MHLQGEVCRQLKCSFFFNPTVVYATHRSKAVVQVYSYSVWLCGLFYGALHVLKVFPCSLSSCFVITFSIVITSLGEEGAGWVLLVHVFVCFVRISFCHFSLPLGVGGCIGL